MTAAVYERHNRVSVDSAPNDVDSCAYTLDLRIVVWASTNNVGDVRSIVNALESTLWLSPVASADVTSSQTIVVRMMVFKHRDSARSPSSI
ncbi:hypothetical protein EXIGLDRAFT_761776 [Exidia glandulosa HHB12029]|uniref:Uncharacterized protein n=1 Tax=Exidia glandulosa HHB12029 TaxID=1314781 RepID=A0A165N9U2_EXIGL|nr:hypothetical protein EXIGLDRAFT_761776 [Exidia glandulosa HHB12029]